MMGAVTGGAFTAKDTLNLNDHSRRNAPHGWEIIIFVTNLLSVLQ
jgi:hypothetical protein